ncbi:MAG TPA: hypothetical protein VIK45_13670, partial [Candidatus Dormibacteraeota bacterium]
MRARVIHLDGCAGRTPSPPGFRGFVRAAAASSISSDPAGEVIGRAVGVGTHVLFRDLVVVL